MGGGLDQSFRVLLKLETWRRPPVTLDRTRWPELLVGLDQIRVLDVARDNDNRVHVAVETTDSTALCTGCGNAATVKDRPLVRLADLPVFGSASILVWRKRRWVCRQGACPVGSWTENRCDIAPPRAQMTTRAGLWATREVGAQNNFSRNKGSSASNSGLLNPVLINLKSH